MRPIVVASAITARRAMKRDLHAEVSARIIAELEAGAAPWVKPWSATPGANTPCNAVSNRPYSGCNVVLLWMAQAADYRTPRFLTFKQALELGGNVRTGERGSFDRDLKYRFGSRQYAVEELIAELGGRSCVQSLALMVMSETQAVSPTGLSF